jgi:hypothetical protein
VAHGPSIALAVARLGWTPFSRTLSRASRQSRLAAAAAAGGVLQAVALFGPGVGRIQQWHAARGPQRLDLIKVRSHIRGFIGRDPPPMGQAPLHRALGGTVAVPGPSPTATPAWLDWALRLLLGHDVHQDGVHVAACGQLVESVHRQQRPLAAALAGAG